MLKRITAVLTVILLLITFCACGTGGDDIIYISLDSMPYTLDAQTAESDSELLVARNIYEGLTRQNENGETVLAACKKYDFSALTYTFTLRDGLKWSDGKPLLAKDFVFGIKRALSPETKSPFAGLLYAIKGAPEVHAGTLNKDNLGIYATDDKTLKMQLSYDDENFLKVLSMPVCMPCREDFFSASTGKYGLEKEYVLSCGSYKLSKWNKTDNGIRLYKNEEYNGSFKPKNGGVFISKDKEKTSCQKLVSAKSDIAVLKAEYLKELKGIKVKIKLVQNICWVISLGGDLDENIRRALVHCFSLDVYGENLPEGFTAATSFFPNALGDFKGLDFDLSYNPDLAREIISEEIKAFKNKKFPSTTLIYSESEPMRGVITEIVGNWQKNLSTFINIKSTDKTLEDELKSHTLSLSAFPVTADSTLQEYLNKFGVSYSGDIKKAQQDICSGYNLLPVAFESTAVGCLENIDGIVLSASGGYFDFSVITKR